ncbi:D-alanyl-D-alanine carboxypeptidase family protein [Dictyobacter arantiisoli]|uniref:Peptidase S11 D-alanyl-D-alanine carboxypeptidase A N-terminal domain-containing protein n=1 Tax=Dictyobacter arantiisoli TaxID=2014874 RepID=A0A5A5THF0_9CHLR|nr:D-alanyl-D-alanine carboxypeptidase [Dictyobacter arantiisoli]GCF10797.1 hypothetical protein KDI_43610 [Dictyobacter arantiisoli]
MEPLDKWFSPDQLEEQLARPSRSHPPTAVNERLLHDLTFVVEEDAQRLERLRARLLAQAADNRKRPPISIQPYQSGMSGPQGSSGLQDVPARRPASHSDVKRTPRLFQLSLGLVALLIIGSMLGIFTRMKSHQPLQVSFQHPASTGVASVPASSVPIHGAAAYMLDTMTGRMLVDINSRAHLPFVGVVRLMTAVVAIENGNLDQSVTISQNVLQEAPQSPSSAQLVAGDRLTLRDLLPALLLSGGNDAAVVIAHTVTGNTPNFVAQMNDEAHQLQLYDTHFNNLYGTPVGDEYSSAADLAHLTRYALQLSEFSSIFGAQQHRVAATEHNHAYQWISSIDAPGITGAISGYDARAGASIVFSSRRADGHVVIGVELGAPSMSILSADTRLLLQQ